MSWPPPHCPRPLHAVTTTAPSRHAPAASPRAHGGASPGAWHWGGTALQPRALPLTLVSTNLRVNRAKLASKARQGHQALPDRVDLWGTQDCQGPWGRP